MSRNCVSLAELLSCDAHTLAASFENCWHFLRLGSIVSDVLLVGSAWSSRADSYLWPQHSRRMVQRGCEFKISSGTQ